MAADWFIRFQKNNKPKKAHLQLILEDFFRGVATEVRWDRDRWFVTLPGSPSWPLARMPDVSENMRQAKKEDGVEEDGSPRPRWMEVWRDTKDGTVNIMTRSQDEFMNALAEGLAKLIARYWQGELEA